MLKSGYKLESNENARSGNFLWKQGKGDLLGKGWVVILFPLIGLMTSLLAIYLVTRESSWMITVALGLPLLVISLIRIDWGLSIVTFLAFCAPGLSQTILGQNIYNLMYGLIGLLFIIVAYRILNEKKSIQWTHPLNLLVLVWFGYNIIIVLSSVAWGQENVGESFIASWSQGKQIIFPVLLFWIGLYALDDLKRILSYSQILILFSVVASLVGFYQEIVGEVTLSEHRVYTNPEVYQQFFADGRFRINSFMKTPFVFGIVLAGVFLLTTVKILGPWSSSLRITYGIFAFLLLIAMMLSGTLTAYAILLVGLLLYAFLSLKKNVVLLVGGILLLGSLYFSLAGNNNFTYKVSSVIHQVQSNPYGSLSDKDTLLREYIFSHPIGSGLGTVKNYSLEILNEVDESTYTFPIKGGYLLMAIEQGWVGFLFFMSLSIAVFWTGIRGYFRSRDLRVRNLYLGFLLLVYVWIIAQYSGYLMQTFPASIVFFTISSIFIKLSQIEHTSMLKLSGRKAATTHLSTT